MADESFKCNVDPFPTPKYAASGGLVGNTPIICGGCCSQKSCYSLKENGSWKVESDLNTARGYTATGSVIFNNKLVIAGGIDGKNKRLATIIREHLYQTQVMGNDSDKILYDIV